MCSLHCIISLCWSLVKQVTLVVVVGGPFRSNMQGVLLKGIFHVVGFKCKYLDVTKAPCLSLSWKSLAWLNYALSGYLSWYIYNFTCLPLMILPRELLLVTASQSVCYHMYVLYMCCRLTTEVEVSVRIKLCSILCFVLKPSILQL